MDGNWSVMMRTNGQQMKALKKWVFVKNITTLCWSVEIHDTLPQSQITQYEQQVSTFSIWWGKNKPKKSWWALTWRGHKKRLLWCWTLSVLVVQPEATVRGVLRGGVEDWIDKPFKFSVCIVLWVGTHKIILPLQCVGVLGGRGRAAGHLLAAGPQGCSQDVLLCPRPLPGWKCSVDSCDVSVQAFIQTAERYQSHWSHKLPQGVYWWLISMYLSCKAPNLENT